VNARKYPSSVYRALRRDGLSNREIARTLGVNESSVRRALKNAPREQRQYLITVEEVD